MDSRHQHTAFMASVREAIKIRHYSLRTQQSYLDWINRFLEFNSQRALDKIGEQEIIRFLTYLVVDKKVAPSTQNQALSAIKFLFNGILHKPVDLTQHRVSSSQLEASGI